MVRLQENYRDQAQPNERTARFMERKDIEAVKRELLSFIP